MFQPRAKRGSPARMRLCGSAFGRRPARHPISSLKFPAIHARRSRIPACARDSTASAMTPWICPRRNSPASCAAKSPSTPASSRLPASSRNDRGGARRRCETRKEEMKAIFSAIAVVGLILSPLGTARAQGYPSGTVRVIVPFTPGSATDIMARTISERLSPALGQPVIVENRPGAGGTIGINVVAKSPPDGLTLAVVSTGHVVNHVLYKDIPYDTIKDLAGVAPLANLPSVLVVPPSLGVKSVRDLVELAKSKPGQFNYGTAGVGSAAHINQEKFNQSTGIQAVHI